MAAFTDSADFTDFTPYRQNHRLHRLWDFTDFLLVLRSPFGGGREETGVAELQSRTKTVQCLGRAHSNAPMKPKAYTPGYQNVRLRPPPSMPPCSADSLTGFKLCPRLNALRLRYRSAQDNAFAFFAGGRFSPLGELEGWSGQKCKGFAKPSYAQGNALRLRSGQGL